MDPSSRATPSATSLPGPGSTPGPAPGPARPPTHRARALVVAFAALCAAAACWALAVPARAQVPSDPLDQTIDADQPVATGPAVLDDGHVDIGPRYVAGAWTLLVHDDSAVPSVWRSLDDAVIQVTDDALQTVPDDPTYGFLGVDPGTEVHVVPQVQRPGVVWVGWNTQDPEVLARIDRGATLTLLGVQGPGALTMYLQAGNLTEPDVLWRSTTAERQPIWVEVNTHTHTHANWVFTEPGVYLVQVEVAAALIDGTTATDVATLRFAVGDATSVSDARTAVYTGPVAVAPDAPGDEDGTPAGSERTTTSPVVVAVGAVALLGAVGAAAARGGRAKRRAEAQRAERARRGETGSSR